MSNFDNFADPNAPQEMNWDTPMTAEPEKEFILLKPGEYEFTITNITKGRYEPKPGGKIPACPKVTLTLEVETKDGVQKSIDTDLFYTEKMKWRIDDVFIGTGIAEEGKEYMPNPDMLLGCTGKCEIIQKPWYSDPTKIFNEVKKILRNGNTPRPYGGF